ncbi:MULTISPECIES: NrsF family protein [Phyllobacteriaceae]|jgi:hypothetical protein|uniref:DUF1109 family protein n=1 Tax=Mesorhizobium hungaricum TaxID=1566387 RepID=A0A1C2DFQ9_9HYPH|nr:MULTISPECIES: NrsF family protein [Mesorhizobium]MBN9232208.1 DUF1109 family protein [Mesorhizobium sp.]MDQ0329803.1 hypothetical protein [Mesorhizobium sp. YL-MeA3-2017]OCX13609.1 hypothetical protein QV13_29585 [Mesorhizobium hungaricum]
MKTNELIKALNADSKMTAMPSHSVWRVALMIAVPVAAAVFFATIGPRPDFMLAAQTMRFLFKFVFTATLAVSAFLALRALSMPGIATGRVTRWLLAAPLLMAAAIAVELFLVPSGDWGRRLIGTNWAICLTFIPLIGLGPLAVFIAALKHAAPTRPVLTGAVAGILAGGLAATFYAAHCTDDSPLFVATWYTLAIAALSGLGSLIGRFYLRW